MENNENCEAANKLGAFFYERLRLVAVYLQTSLTRLQEGYWVNLILTVHMQEARCRIRYTEEATGWTDRGSNPGTVKRFFFSCTETSRPALAPTQLSMQCVPAFFPGGKA